MRKLLDTKRHSPITLDLDTWIVLRNATEYNRKSIHPGVLGKEAPLASDCTWTPG